MIQTQFENGRNFVTMLTDLHNLKQEQNLTLPNHWQSLQQRAWILATEKFIKAKINQSHFKSMFTWYDVIFNILPIRVPFSRTAGIIWCNFGVNGGLIHDTLFCFKMYCINII